MSEAAATVAMPQVHRVQTRTPPVHFIDHRGIAEIGAVGIDPITALIRYPHHGARKRRWIVQELRPNREGIGQHRSYAAVINDFGLLVEVA